MADAPVLSDELRRIIHGQVDKETKRAALQQSLQNWWGDYSHRKNEEEDMVADSLLYDERCHLPRTTAGPRREPEPEVTAAPPPPTPPLAGSGPNPNSSSSQQP